jgi:fatty acid/phospholipid biosynthesis enzyme
LRGLVVIAHGSSSRVAVANAIRLAARGVEHDVVGRLEERLASPASASAPAAGAGAPAQTPADP